MATSTVHGAITIVFRFRLKYVRNKRTLI